MKCYGCGAPSEFIWALGDVLVGGTGEVDIPVMSEGVCVCRRCLPGRVFRQDIVTRARHAMFDVVAAQPANAERQSRADLSNDHS